MTDQQDFTSLVKVKDFVEKRAVQIADLLKVVDNSLLVSGEVTKGPRTAAQRLPRHMRRRAMAYEIRRFPKGLRSFASSFLISNHRKKPPCRYFRRRPRNLLLNYIRRQKNAIWLETHIWHAKRFHMAERWGYRLPDRSFQRNFRSIYRSSMRHCTVRDKSYLNCFLITGPSQYDLINLLRPFCNSAVAPTFAFKSALSGEYEVSTLLYKPNSYPEGLLGPARFLWINEKDKAKLAVWIHPSCKNDFFPLLISHLSLTKKENSFSVNKTPVSYDDWCARNTEIETEMYQSNDGLIIVEDLKDQLVRLRFYGPRSLDIVKASIQLSNAEDSEYSDNHSEWNNLSSVSEIPDSRIFSLLIEDPRVYYPRGPTIPRTKGKSAEKVRHTVPVPDIWNREKRIDALDKRLPDAEMNKLKSNSLTGSLSTPVKIPIIVINRHLASGKQESLEGIEIIAPAGFGRDLWISAQLRTAHASGLRDDLAAHLESSCLAFPADYFDSSAGSREELRMQQELQEAHSRRPHNRRVLHWKNNAIKYPYAFQFSQLVSDWRDGCDSQPYLLRDRRALLEIDDWLRGRSERPEKLLEVHQTAMITLKLSCILRGRPKRFALVCLPQKQDLLQMRECQYLKKPFILKEDKDQKLIVNPSNNQQDISATHKGDNFWKDVVSLDLSAIEKPIALKPLFPDYRNKDKAFKRKLLNRKKKEIKKRRLDAQRERLEALNQEENEKKQTLYRFSACREIVGRVLRGDFSFTEARGTAFCAVPLCVLPEIVASGRILLVRNITSKYYHPVKVSVLKHIVEI